MISLCPGVEPGNVTAMAVAGVGLWVAVANSSNIQLYHTESFIHLQVFVWFFATKYIYIYCSLDLVKAFDTILLFLLGY